MPGNTNLKDTRSLAEKVMVEARARDRTPQFDRYCFPGLFVGVKTQSADTESHFDQRDLHRAETGVASSVPFGDARRFFACRTRTECRSSLRCYLERFPIRLNRSNFVVCHPRFRGG